MDIGALKLADLLKYQLYLIKPNNEELKEIFNPPVDSEENIVADLEWLHEQGAQNISPTLGENNLV